MRKSFNRGLYKAVNDRYFFTKERRLKMVDERDVRELLEGAIKSDIDNMNDLELGSEKRSRHAEDLSKLMKVYNEDYKYRMDAIYREEEIELEKHKVESELEMKQQTVDNEVKQSKLKTVMTGVTLVAGTGLTLLGFRLEQKGYIVPKGVTDTLSKFNRFLG